jgi:hypothetical protein
MSIIDFVEFPKIARLSREVIVTKKIDGTNGTIYIGDDGEFLVGSRTRWITNENDNHGFARWAIDHQGDLMKLGPGWHRGEWWGSGIQRGYGLPKGEKRFSLFNTIRWCLCGTEPQVISEDEKGNAKMQDVLPACCSLVPVLWRGLFSTGEIEATLICLAVEGSRAALGFRPAEGIVIYHVAGNIAFKKTLGSDGHKGK